MMRLYEKNKYAVIYARTSTSISISIFIYLILISGPPFLTLRARNAGMRAGIGFCFLISVVYLDCLSRSKYVSKVRRSNLFLVARVSLS